ncbi:ABC transporter ATP-binding protein [Intrasporangium sp. YIM S08009]|uniref:ABC transporter ATP-binding protein n=1 Tax=Intrasporangium zincisolvens TaxID=3080018 RepID=UPI002B058F6B|nr:ABC transporter ATP-binding protein [Intrasporangium sp. YIM S08009]
MGARPGFTGTIEVRGLTKRFGSFTAVDHLDLDVEPGRITGFLGPNGSGKTTTLRMLLGLIRPTAGTATIDGRRYVDIPNPLAVVGSALEATNFHPGRSGRDHLRVQASVAGVPSRRVDELLELVGIPAAARKRAGGYSMGMRQRLGLAAALLGDPQVVILDEPANGLDPEGIRWLRGFLRHLAGEGRTLLISSHMLSEVEQTVDDVVIIANGRRVAQGTVAELRGEPTAFVRTSDPDRLAGALRGRGLHVDAVDGRTALRVTTQDLQVVGDVAHANDVAIHELRGEQTHLEELFFNLTESGEHRNRNLGDDTPAPSATPSATAPDASHGISRAADAPPALPPDLPPPSGPPVDHVPPPDASGGSGTSGPWAPGARTEGEAR